MPYIGRSTDGMGVRSRFIYTASGSETSKSGADDNGATLSFTDGAYVDVYLNGVLLKPDTDYVTSTANTIGSLTALVASDILEVIVYDVFSVSDTVSAASGGTFNSDVNVKGDFDVISEATSGYHPTLKIDRQQSDTAADNDPLGQLEFSGRNDAAEQVNYFRMRGKIKDASDGTEDAQMAFKIMTAGSLTDRIVLEGGQPIELDGGVVVNESSADVDFRVESNGQTHKFFVDGGNDVVCLGLSTPETIGGQMPGLQIEGTDYKGGQVSIWRNANDDAGAYLILGKSRGTSLNSDTIVQDGDDCGIINFIGADGGDRAHPVASIRGAVDGTPGSNDMPGRIEFWTTADGGTTLTERFSIDTDGKLNSPSHFYLTAGGDTAFFVHTNGTQRMKMDSGRTDLAHELRISTSGTGSRLNVKSTGASENTIFAEGDSQDDGHTLYAYTFSAQSGNCLRVYQDSTGCDSYTSFFHTDADTSPMYINRNGGDGQIVAYAQGGTVEGSVSISGSTTSFNAFTGSHWSRLIDNSKPTILRGTVLETLDDMCVWYHLKYTIPAVLWKEGDEDISKGKKVGDERYGEQVIKEPYAKPDNKNVGDKVDYDHKGTTYEATIEKTEDVKHVMCKISDTADCTNVYGVFMSWDNDDDSVNDMYVNAVGTSLVRIHKDQTVSKGDLLTSNGDGTAKKQSDDIIRSKTIGKVLSNKKQETYSDGSYVVPCALYCG